MPNISEKDFESTIEAALLAGGVDATATGVAETTPLGPYLGGGFHQRKPEDYDRERCLIARDLLDFLRVSQPKEYTKLLKSQKQATETELLGRVCAEIASRGTLDVLRKGIKLYGCKFDLCYFKPASGLNTEIQRRCQANIFSVARQLKYSLRNENSLDMVIFLNGLPLFTAELKDPLTGQTVLNAVSQYKRDRDPRESLFKRGRCLAHFAVDGELVYFCTELAGAETRFFPFNRGNAGGAGNPPGWRGYATAYLWEQVWSRESILNLIQYFVHQVDELDDDGKKTGKKMMLFPRYHQLDCVRRLVEDAHGQGAGQKYLVQHSAGSGKSNSIAWLAHQLSVLHDAADTRVFDSVVVVTDRRVLDRQLRQTVEQFEQTPGIVEAITENSQQLRQALEEGKQIIVTTVQKFPFISETIGKLPGRHFAVIIDEAHSSQSGETSKHLSKVLSAGSLEAAEQEDSRGAEEDDTQSRILAEIARRGQQKNTSYFAFTATPKPATLELFGTKQKGGSFAPFSLYSMRQAIEEKFILDVLLNYTTYKAYWNLLKKIKDDPKYDKNKAERLLINFVELHEHTISEKVKIIVEHFDAQVRSRINGHAKAMIVTRSRLHAVRYKLAVDAYLREKGLPFQALVAFSGKVRDGAEEFTEAGMNGFGEAQTAGMFRKDEYRLMIVAEKFQTGYDMPLLHTMYVDKRLAGLHAVQTLSRLNRIYPGKDETFVLDFANDAELIQKSFEPYYERTSLKEATDPNLLYDLQTRLEGYRIYTAEDMEKFAREYFDPKGKQEKLFNLLRPVADRFAQLSEEDQSGCRITLRDYTKLYAFLAQVMSFADADLEKLFVFAKLLLRRLPPSKSELPVEVQEAIDISTYRLDETFHGKIGLGHGKGELEPPNPKSGEPLKDQKEALSKIIAELNKQHGTDFKEEDIVAIQELEARLAANPSVQQSIVVNTPENAKLTFDAVMTELLMKTLDTNIKLVKKMQDSPEFAETLSKILFKRVSEEVGERREF